MDLNKTKQKKAKQIKGEQKRHDAKLFDLSIPLLEVTKWI